MEGVGCVHHTIYRILFLWLWTKGCQAAMTTSVQFCDIIGPGSYLPEEMECPGINDKLLTTAYVPWGLPGRAWYTIPPEITIKKSIIPEAGLGAFANTFIKAHTWLAEYEGHVVVNDTGHSEYAWSSTCNEQETHLVDAGNTATSNWVRWVNCARNPQELNVESIWCYGRVFYVSIRDIYPSQELFVYYGQNYAEDLGIDILLFYDGQSNDDEENEDEEYFMDKTTVFA